MGVVWLFIASDLAVLVQTDIMVEHTRSLADDYGLDGSTELSKTLFIAIASRLKRAAAEFEGVAFFEASSQQHPPELARLHQHQLVALFKVSWPGAAAGF